MRNDSQKWTPAQGWARPPVQVGPRTLSCLRPLRQTLISGPVPAALDLAGLPVATGWPEPATGACYAVRLRRDRILVVGGAALPEGWTERLAISDMSSGYAVLELTGADLLPVLQRGTEISWQGVSASAARAFFGYAAVIYPHTDRARCRIHVSAAHLDGLWDLLGTFLRQADSVSR